MEVLQMSAALAIAFRAPLFLHQEGLVFWEELTQECRRHTQSINNAAIAHGLDSGYFLEWKPGRSSFGMERKIYPSTEATVSLSFEHWGPVIKVVVTGCQHEDLRYYPHEHEVTIARDLDGRTVAVLGEGRSYSPAELACYIAQHFRRCFPDMALPCTPDERN
jgi:hypothetical protein